MLPLSLAIQNEQNVCVKAIESYIYKNPQIKEPNVIVEALKKKNIMGQVLSDCFQGICPDFSASIFNKQKVSRKQALEEMLANKENPDVDGRRFTADPLQRDGQASPCGTGQTYGTMASGEDNQRRSYSFFGYSMDND